MIIIYFTFESSKLHIIWRTPFSFTKVCFPGRIRRTPAQLLQVKATLNSHHWENSTRSTEKRGIVLRKSRRCVHGIHCTWTGHFSCLPAGWHQGSGWITGLTGYSHKHTDDYMVEKYFSVSSPLVVMKKVFSLLRYRHTTELSLWRDDHETQASISRVIYILWRHLKCPRPLFPCIGLYDWGTRINTKTNKQWRRPRLCVSMETRPRHKAFPTACYW